MNQRLFDKIAVTVAVAMQHKSQDERHNGRVVTKVTRDIMEAVREELPELIDIAGKWEIADEDYVHVSLNADQRHDRRQLLYLSKFATDQGYNTAILKMHQDLLVPLKKPKKDAIIE